MDEQLKQLPHTSTRRDRIDAVCVALTIGYMLTTLAVFKGWMTEDQVAMVGVTFDRWWIGVGLMIGGYVASENAKKHSFAVLNK